MCTDVLMNDYVGRGKETLTYICTRNENITQLIQHHTTSTMRMHAAAEKMILFVCVARCGFLKTGSRRAPKALEAAAVHMLISKELGLVPSTWDLRCPGTKKGLLFLLQNLICAIFSLLSLLILEFARPRE